MSETLQDILEMHGNTVYDMATPKQFTQNGGWNVRCGCGSHLGDTGGDDSDDRLEVAHRKHTSEELEIWIHSHREAAGRELHRQACQGAGWTDLEMEGAWILTPRSIRESYMARADVVLNLLSSGVDDD